MDTKTPIQQMKWNDAIPESILELGQCISQEEIKAKLAVILNPELLHGMKSWKSEGVQEKHFCDAFFFEGRCCGVWTNGERYGIVLSSVQTSKDTML